MTPSDVEDVYELSPLQQGMLLHSLYGGDADTYVAQRSFEIDGPLDPDALLQAWQQTVAAHTALRTSFHWKGLDKPLQVVHRDVTVTMRRHDWHDVGEGRQRDLFTRLLADDRAAGFDPARVPLLRLHLVRLGDERHGFVWTHHMLPVDGWSVPIVINEVVRRYVGLTTGLPAPPAAPAYRDYIAWLQYQDLEAARAYWSTALDGHRDVAPLGPLLPEQPERPAGPVAEVVSEFPTALATELRALGARHQVTLNTVLQAAWALVLQRYSGGTAVIFGFASSGRPAQLRGVDRMVGTFINTLPICLPVPDDGDLGRWLRDIQVRHTAARRYEYSPLAQIKTWAAVAGPRPLFDSVLVLDNYPFTVALDGLAQRLAFRPVNTFEKTSQPLTLLVTPEPASTLRLVGHRERLLPGTLDGLMEHLRSVLAAMPSAHRIGQLVQATRHGDGAGRGETVAYPYPRGGLADLVRRQATATPDAVAVVTDDGTVTYRALWSGAERVVATLAAAGVGPGHVVGVLAQRSAEMVTALVGVLASGAAYLPLEPSLPVARLALMVGDAGVDVVLAQRDAARTAASTGARRVLTLGEPATPRPPLGAPAGSDLAYVMYTSGSTGQPKGVAITHEAIVNRLLWMQETFRLTPADRVLHKTPLGFDVSVWELFWPLITGATVVVARPGGHQDSAYLAQTIDRHAVTTAHFVPSMLELFLEEPSARRLPALRRVVCSGEQLPYPLTRRFQELLPEVELHNLYGPTEAAVDITWWDCSRPAPPGVVPIGHPVANCQAYVLDRGLSPAPVGVPGELFLGGVQLARGYLNRPALTAQRFVAHPLAGPGGRLYRTGDLARRLPDGALEFLGRGDHQVKVRGYRIELGEIEHTLAGHASVRQAVVIARQTPDGPRLAAYVTVHAGYEPQALREHLHSQLPRYMVPATITVLPALPVTGNGKLDRAALPDPAQPARSQRPTAPPATAREEAVASVYRDTLGLAEIDVDSSFFDLGGDSFAAVRAARRIDGATVGLLTAHPSVRDLAAALDRQRSTPPGRLLRLTPAGPVAHTLVCVPYGGGSAIGYRALAAALPAHLALLAVSLPGHDLGGDDELRALDEVAQECAQAVLSTVDGPVSVYGHCVGVALAVELVRRLEAAGRAVSRLFLGASYPVREDGPLRRGLRWPRRGPDTDQDQLRYLQSLGGFGGVVDDEELALVMRALRHDADGARRYFSQVWWSGRTPPLTTPITFIAGTDDPETPRYERRHRAWRRVSQTVDLATVPGAGHYFLQHQPRQLADIIEAALAAERGPHRPPAQPEWHLRSKSAVTGPV